MDITVATDVNWAPIPNEVKMVVPQAISLSGIPEPVTSAFAIITRPGDAGPEVLLVDVGKRGLDLPGGHREPGESVKETIEREVLEETGLDITERKIEALGWLNLSVSAPKPVDYDYPYPETYLAFAHVKMPYGTEVPGTSMPQEIIGYQWVDLDKASTLTADRTWVLFFKCIQ